MLTAVTVVVMSILVKSLAEEDLEKVLSQKLREEFNIFDHEVFTRAFDLVQSKVCNNVINEFNPRYVIM